jgi:predicted O-linked N-acetylglucosamine transferase (SPINDLY family)
MKDEGGSGAILRPSSFPMTIPRSNSSRSTPGVHSNLVYTLHFHPGHDARTIAEERQRWNRQFSDPLKRFILPHANDRSPERRLRIGYVSPDFRDHVVGRNLLPLFERHDRGILRFCVIRGSCGRTN